MTLTKQQILDVNDSSTKLVIMPEWQGDVLIKKMNIEEHINFTKSIKEDSSELDCMFNLLRYAVINDDKSYMFDSEQECADVLRIKDRDSVTKLFNEAASLNSLGSQKEVEEKAKNS